MTNRSEALSEAVEQAREVNRLKEKIRTLANQMNELNEMRGSKLREAEQLHNMMRQIEARMQASLEQEL